MRARGLGTEKTRLAQVKVDADNVSFTQMALQILHQLEAASGRLEKEAILKAHATDQTFKEVCRLTLDPLTNFYIKKLPAAGPKPTGDTWSLDKALKSIEGWLATRKMRVK